MRQRKPSREVCAMWLWDTVNHAIAEFAEVSEEEFKKDWGLWMKAHGCLSAVGQDLHRHLGVAAEDLEDYFRELRNELGHDYMMTPPEALWEGIRKLPHLRESIEQNIPRDVLEGRSMETRGFVAERTWRRRSPHKQ